MKKIEANDFCKLRFLSSVEFAPDGKTLCFAVTQADEKKNSYSSNLYIRKDGKLRQLTSGGKERSFVWLDSDTVLFQGNRDESKAPSIESKFYKISISGGEATLAFTLPIPAERVIPLKNGDLLAVCSTFPGYEELYKGDAKLAKKYLDAAKTNEDYEVITQNPWWWNGGTFTRGAYSTLYYYSTCAKALTPLTPFGMSVTDLSLTQDESRVFYSLLDQSCAVPNYFGGAAVYECDLAKKTSSPVIDSKKGFIINGFFAAESGLILEVCDEHCGLCGGNDIYLLPYGENDAKLYARLNADFDSSVGSDVRYGGGKAVKVVGDTLYFISTVEDSAYLFKLKNGIITRLSDKKGSVDCFDVCGDDIVTVALYDMRPQELYTVGGKRLSSFNSRALSGKYIAAPETLNISRGDYEVCGFVLKPFDYQPGRKYPVIIDIHGGPKTVYGPVFYHEMQYWASLGYFVIFCNPTGSDGRGDFMDIRGKYGKVDYEDLMAFCDGALEAYPDMDKDNFFETGGSYGGFMTNWIVGHTDRFRACASQRSISNWFSFCGVSDIGYAFGKDQTGADIWSSPEKMWEHSPLKYADKCKTPTLFIHSFEDYRCPIDQGYQMFSAIVQNGVEAKMVCFKGENHELSRSGKPQHRLRRLNEITQWFEKHKI